MCTLRNTLKTWVSDNNGESNGNVNEKDKSNASKLETTSLFLSLLLVRQLGIQNFFWSVYNFCLFCIIIINIDIDMKSSPYQSQLMAIDNNESFPCAMIFGKPGLNFTSKKYKAR